MVIHDLDDSGYTKKLRKPPYIVYIRTLWLFNSLLRKPWCLEIDDKNDDFPIEHSYIP